VLKAQEAAEFPQRVGVKLDRRRTIIIMGMRSKVPVHIRVLWRPVEGEPDENGIAWQAIVVVTTARGFHSLHTEK
jgi:hypothetical protein